MDLQLNEIILGLIIFLIAYRLGRVEGELAGIKRFYKASPEGIAINEDLENVNANLGRRRFENHDLIQMVKSIRSQAAFVEEQLDTDSRLLELDQERNHKLKDLLIRK